MKQQELPGEVSDHGGSLTRARRLFPDAPLPWIDLSTGINPLSYPLPALPATAYSSLPEIARLQELHEAACKFYGVPHPQNIVAAPGTQILLPLVMGLVRPGRAAVLSPTYAEHARAARIAGHQVIETPEFSDLETADLAIIVNPNNPDGRIISRATILDLAARIAAKGGLLVVDEAFMEVGPQGASVAGDAAIKGLVVLRSFGKFFGLAELRLGFALAQTQIAARLAAMLGPWAVSGPALEIGILALRDHVWQKRMRVHLHEQSLQLDALLARHDMVVEGGTSLYRFVPNVPARLIFEKLGKAGILIRNFKSMPEALRFGLPHSAENFTRLEDALS